jgi:sterol desaturase/sphingolipid hydroxylase (fatty acid hydroxylase superfamily)
MIESGFSRLLIFVSVLTAVGLAELFFPRRPLTVSKASRWLTNLTIVIIDNAVARLVLPILPFGAAELSSAYGWGVLNQISVPGWFKLLTAVTLLDLAIYLQHRASHHWGWFWRMHRMHHTDLDLDVTSGVRFHPIEIILSTLLKIGVIVMIGASPAAVVLFEVILSSTALFNHGNFKLPLVFDRWLRLFLVTPDVHRVHHSVYPFETNSNYGFSITWWDRLFGTYREQPKDGHLGMAIGLKEYRNFQKLNLQGLLMIPFKKPYG